MISAPFTVADGAAIRTVLMANGWTMQSESGTGASYVGYFSYGTNPRIWKLYYATKWTFSPTTDGTTVVTGAMSTASSMTDLSALRIVKSADSFMIIANAANTNVWAGCGTIKLSDGSWIEIVTRGSAPSGFSTVYIGDTSVGDNIFGIFGSLLDFVVAKVKMSNFKQLMYPVYARKTSSTIIPYAIPKVYSFGNADSFVAGSLVYAEGKPHIIGYNQGGGCLMFRDPEA